MEQELDLLQIWQVIAKRWRVIIFIPLLAAVTSAAVSLYILTPQYQASAMLMVMKPTDTAHIVMSDIQVSRQLVMTYREISRSRRVLEDVIGRLRLPYSVSELREKVEVASVRDTEIITITVTDPDPAMAQLIANEVSRSFMTQVVDIMKVENVSLIDPAPLPGGPVSPRVPLNVAVAFVVGLMAAVGLAFLVEYMDKSIRTPEDVQRYLQLPVLGVIPYIEE